MVSDAPLVSGPTPEVSRRPKGTTREEVTVLQTKAVQPSPGDIREKMRAGNWGGPTKLTPDGTASPSRHLSVSQETSLKLAKAVGSTMRVSTLRGREAERAAGARETPTVTAGHCRAKMAGSHWPYADTEEWRDIGAAAVPTPRLTTYARCSVCCVCGCVCGCVCECVCMRECVCVCVYVCDSLCV